MKKNSLLNFLSDTGYKRNSPDVNRPLNVIPSGRITMQDVDFPVRGVDNLGNEMFMMPGGEYFFPGDYVVETPMMQRGGLTFQQYYTPASESTGANYTPTMTVQAAERLKAMRDAQELARRKQAIQASQAAASRSFRERLTPENLAQETGATGDKLRFFPNDPDSFIDDYLNPLKMVGDMASGLGRIPLNVKQGNYGAAALDVAIPVAIGALAGLGAKSAGQFVNNLANPLAGTGQFLTTKTPLKNAYKINPWAFKPNPDFYYRMGEGRKFLDDVLETNKIRAYNENSYANLREAGKISGIREDGKIVLKAKTFPEADTYWSKGVPLDGRYASQKYGDYMIEASNDIPFIQAVNQKTKQRGFWDAPDVNYNATHTTGNYVKPRQSYGYDIEGNIKPSIGTPLEYNPDLIKLYKPHWLKGYKEVPNPTSNFKSEIDWAKWNPDTPKYPELINEYNAIEESTKKAGTWMKNSDGTAFQGTPEQFIQQQSSWFKKAFPEGFENVYRGVQANTSIPVLNPGKSVFTSDYDLAKRYSGLINPEILTPFNNYKSEIYLSDKFKNKGGYEKIGNESLFGDWGVFNLAHKKSPNSFELNFNKNSWVNLPLETKEKLLLDATNEFDRVLQQYKMLKKTDPELYSYLVENTSNKLQKNRVELQGLRNLKENDKTLLETLSKKFGNKTTTDDLAKYLEEHAIDYAKLNNIDDSGLGDVTIVNHKPGNYLKSLIGNVGFFDMTNPNIFKSIFPYLGAGALGAGALQETPQYQKGGQQVGTDILDKYKSYIMGDYKPEEEKDLKNTYDKLNRHYYKKAKETGKSVPNYIMSLL